MKLLYRIAKIKNVASGNYNHVIYKVNIDNSVMSKVQCT